jgi:hypothetical protein
MGQLIPAVRTPLTDDSVIHSLEEAWPLELGGSITHQTLAVLAAQIRLETGMKNCWDNNPGNYKRYGQWDWMRLKTTEYIDGNPVEISDDFAAFPDLATGMQMFLRAQSTGRWPLAWHAALAGDPSGYARALGARPLPYYTGPVADYTAGVTRFFAYYLAILGGATNPRPPDVSDLKIAFLMPDTDPLADTLPGT